MTWESIGSPSPYHGYRSNNARSNHLPPSSSPSHLPLEHYIFTPPKNGSSISGNGPAHKKSLFHSSICYPHHTKSNRRYLSFLGSVPQSKLHLYPLGSITRYLQPSSRHVQWFFKLGYRCELDILGIDSSAHREDDVKGR